MVRRTGGRTFLCWPQFRPVDYQLDRVPLKDEERGQHTSGRPLCGSGETSRHTALKMQRRKAYACKSRGPHHSCARGETAYAAVLRTAVRKDVPVQFGPGAPSLSPWLGSSISERRTHNPGVAGGSPARATIWSVSVVQRRTPFVKARAGSIAPTDLHFMQSMRAATGEIFLRRAT